MSAGFVIMTQINTDTTIRHNYCSCCFSSKNYLRKESGTDEIVTSWCTMLNIFVGFGELHFECTRSSLIFLKNFLFIFRLWINNLWDDSYTSYRWLGENITIISCKWNKLFSLRIVKFWFYSWNVASFILKI